MINYGKQFIDQSDIKAVIKVLKSSYLTQGPEIIKFEKKLKLKNYAVLFIGETFYYTQHINI